MMPWPPTRERGSGRPPTHQKFGPFHHSFSGSERSSLSTWKEWPSPKSMFSPRLASRRRARWTVSQSTQALWSGTTSRPWLCALPVSPPPSAPPSSSESRKTMEWGTVEQDVLNDFINHTRSLQFRN